jgi:hypothetical protein
VVTDLGAVAIRCTIRDTLSRINSSSVHLDNCLSSNTKSLINNKGVAIKAKAVESRTKVSNSNIVRGVEVVDTRSLSITKLRIMTATKNTQVEPLLIKR